MSPIIVALAYLIAGFVVLNIESILVSGWVRVRDSYTWERIKEQHPITWAYLFAFLLLWPLVIIGWAGNIADEILAWLNYQANS